MEEVKSTSPFITPLTTEILVPRIGDYLVEKGLISPEQLDQALHYQESKRRAGNPLLLGQVLVELHLVTHEELDTATAEQIYQYQMALQEHNQQLELRVKERTAELQRALNKLSEVNQLKNNFISNISHELRTPLTHIKGYLELLASASLGPLNSSQHSALQVMIRSTDRLERLIQDLIQFALVEKGELSLSITQVDIVGAIQKVANNFRKAAEEKTIDLVLETSDETALIVCDEEKISWVLTQLVDNAIKFTPAEGQVVIGAKFEHKLAYIFVRDTGIGIPANRINELFIPFHQLDGSATRRYGGTGLGLALVKQIIEAHGTTIKVQSEPDKGACFEFVLPVAEDSA